MTEPTGPESVPAGRTHPVVWLLVFLLALGWGVQTAQSPHFQEDFHILYTAAEAHNQGLNPYDKQELSEVAGKEMKLPFVYPPYTLPLLEPLARLDYPVAAGIFLVVKLALLAGLLILWRGVFLSRGDVAPFLLCMFLAFNCTLFSDVVAGNMSVFEQFFLWLGFSFYVRGRHVWFAALVVLAASAKLVLIVFLGLLVLGLTWRKLAVLVGAGLTFAGLLAASYALAPELFVAFLDNVRALGWEQKEYNPSTWALLLDAGNHFLGALEGIDVPRLMLTLYGLIAIGVLATSWFVWRRLRCGPAAMRPVHEVFLACFSYALLVPRLKNYSFILLLVPAYWVISTHRSPRPFFWMFLLLIFPTVHLELPLVEQVQPYLVHYYALLLAYLLWGTYCGDLVHAAHPPTLSDKTD
jgi:hypothetical protein